MSSANTRLLWRLFYNFIPVGRRVRECVFDIVEQDVLCILDGDLTVAVDIACEELHIVEIALVTGHPADIFAQNLLCIVYADSTVAVGIAEQEVGCTVAAEKDSALCAGDSQIIHIVINEIEAVECDRIGRCCDVFGRRKDQREQFAGAGEILCCKVVAEADAIASAVRNRSSLIFRCKLCIVLNSLERQCFCIPVDIHEADCVAGILL